MDQITVCAAVDQVQKVVGFVNARLEALGCSERAKVQIDVAVDEIFSNIAHYAYALGTGLTTVSFEAEGPPPGVILTFIDRGVPYDPLAEERPNTTRLPKMERPIGGLGLFLVKNIMDDISYAYRDGQNILTIRKRI